MKALLIAVCILGFSGMSMAATHHHHHHHHHSVQHVHHHHHKHHRHHHHKRHRHVHGALVLGTQSSAIVLSTQPKHGPDIAVMIGF